MRLDYVKGLIGLLGVLLLVLGGWRMIWITTQEVTTCQVVGIANCTQPLRLPAPLADLECQRVTLEGVVCNRITNLTLESDYLPLGNRSGIWRLGEVVNCFRFGEPRCQLVFNTSGVGSSYIVPALVSILGLVVIISTLAVHLSQRRRRKLPPIEMELEEKKPLTSE